MAIRYVKIALVAFGASVKIWSAVIVGIANQCHTDRLQLGTRAHHTPAAVNSIARSAAYRPRPPPARNRGTRTRALPLQTPGQK